MVLRRALIWCSGSPSSCCCHFTNWSWLFLFGEGGRQIRGRPSFLFKIKGKRLVSVVKSKSISPHKLVKPIQTTMLICECSVLIWDDLTQKGKFEEQDVYWHVICGSAIFIRFGSHLVSNLKGWTLLLKRSQHPSTDVHNQDKVITNLVPETWLWRPKSMSVQSKKIHQ
jgi:hypothetical protein